MADSQSTNGGKRRRELALTEIEALCVNTLRDLEILRTSIECILAETKEARQ